MTRTLCPGYWCCTEEAFPLALRGVPIGHGIGVSVVRVTRPLNLTPFSVQLVWLPKRYGLILVVKF